MHLTIEQLPPGGMFVAHDVPWDDYEQLLREVSHRPGVRITYDQGRLQAVAPLRAHEHYAQVLADIASLTAEALDLPFEQLGSTTFRQRAKSRGVEPDRCFYIVNAHRILGRLTLDLDTDPPPDIVVEIDLSSDSDTKLPIYASMGVPEIWRFDGAHASILRLASDGAAYAPSPASRFYPVLSPAVLDEHLALSKVSGQKVFRRAFRAWLQTTLPAS